MTGHEAQDEVPLQGVQLPQKIGKIQAAPQVLPIGVHVLAQEIDLFETLCDQFPGFPDHVLRLPAPLPAPDIGDDAVGAEIVAAVHDGEPGPHPGGMEYRKPLITLPVDIPGLVDPAPVGGIELLQQLREPPDLMGTEDQIHIGVGGLQLFPHMGLLHHAAAEGKALAGLGSLGVAQGAHVPQDPQLRVAPDGAGIQEDEVRLLLPVRKAPAHIPEHAPEALAVRLVLLAAVGIHKGQGGRRQGGVMLRRLRHDLPLPRQLLRRHRTDIRHLHPS